MYENLGYLYLRDYQVAGACVHFTNIKNIKNKIRNNKRAASSLYELIS